MSRAVANARVFSHLPVTNLDFARWTEVFGDAQMTAALLDRVTHRCHIIAHTGESYRFRESLRRKTTETPA